MADILEFYELSHITAFILSFDPVNNINGFYFQLSNPIPEGKKFIGVMFNTRSPGNVVYLQALNSVN